MTKNYLLKQVHIVNEGNIQVADVLIAGGRIEKIAPNIDSPVATEINGEGLHLLPGVIDDQVHFREPGLTHKATIASEAKAAVAGGVTSFMEMPNTIPNALTQELLEEKYQIAANSSLANFSFFMGTSNQNADEVLRTNDRKKDICGIKIFMGASTGNMLVDNYVTLDKIFREAEVLIATHCEDERIIKQQMDAFAQTGKELTPADHPIIRNEEACFESSLTAIQFAKKYDTRLHILHISTAKELALFSNMLTLAEKRITSEVCVHHLHFTADDYDTLGYQIKCNPAIKAAENKEALWKALLNDQLDIIATDHAPHTMEEKGILRGSDGRLINKIPNPGYAHCHAGLPLVQHSLPLMLKYVQEGRISLEKMVEKMSHAPAICFEIENRGFIREGYFADLVLVNLNRPQTVQADNLLYKCGWSPMEGLQFPASITHTFVNGHLVYKNEGPHYGNPVWDESQFGSRLRFNRS